LCCVDEQLWSGLSADWITENPKSLAPTYDPLENVESLRIQLGSKNAHSSGIAARLGQAVVSPAATMSSTTAMIGIVLSPAALLAPPHHRRQL
jgi:hypothetical protein